MRYSKISTSLLIGASVLTIGACSIGHPNAIPTGYTHHHKTYKSPTPAPSPRVHEAQRATMDGVQAEQFRSAAYDVISRLTIRAGLPPKPVFVLVPDPMTPFYAHIDNDLRESMRSIGYAISDRPEGAYVFAYSADLIDRPRGMEGGAQPNIELILKVFNSADPQALQLTQETGTYFIKGAEEFDVHPTVYADLPTYQTIRQQIEGFDSFDTPRTSVGDLNTSVNETRKKMPMLVEQKITEPMADSIVMTDPIQPVIIDSSNVSYEGPLDAYQPTTPRLSASATPRISREIDY